MSENQKKPFNSKVKLFINIVRENMGLNKDEDIDDSRRRTDEGFEVLADVCSDMFITIAKEFENMKKEILLLRSLKDGEKNTDGN